MKKLLILILSISSLSLTAQEKQNDATWQETISFISKYQKYIESTISWSGYGYNKLSYKNENLYISSNKIICTSRMRYSHNTSSYKQIKYSVDLSKIKSAYNSGNKLSLYFTGNNVNFQWGYVNDGGSLSGKNDYNRNELVFVVPDSEMRPRLLKAFKQLAYLAKEKRDVKRKQSGDKF